MIKNINGFFYFLGIFVSGYNIFIDCCVDCFGGIGFNNQYIQLFCGVNWWGCNYWSRRGGQVMFVVVDGIEFFFIYGVKDNYINKF